MRQCKKCGKKGLFLKIEDDTGLCLSCNEEFAGKGKSLTERIIEAKNAVAAAEPNEAAKLSEIIEDFGKRLVALHEEYHIQPSQELLDIIETYKRRRRPATE